MKKIILTLLLILTLASCNNLLYEDKEAVDIKTICATDDECKTLASSSDNPEVLDKLSLYNHTGVRALVAKNPNTKKSTLTAMLNDNNTVINYIAANTNAGDDILTKLSNNDDDMIRHAVAKNPSTPLIVLMKFVEDKSPNVQKKLAQNESLTEEIMLAMVEKSMNSALITLLERNDLTENVINALKENDNELIRAKAEEYKFSIQK